MQVIGNQRELMQQVHENSINHGWWESKPSPQHFLCLVVCELAEAVEAARINKRANVERFEHLMNWKDTYMAEADGADLYSRYFEECIKDSVEDELADAYIRLLDLAGGIGLRWRKPKSREGCSMVRKHATFTENIYEIMSNATSTWLNEEETIIETAAEIEILAFYMDIDLKKHIEMKMRYNINREYKHGKAF